MKYLIYNSGELHSCIAIENFEFNSELFELIETNIVPTFIRNKWNGTDWEDITTDEDIIVEIPQAISPAEFKYGLWTQGKITQALVMYFIENYIEDEDTQAKALFMFEGAIEFKYNNEMLIMFLPMFNQYLTQIGKEPIIYDNIFINGVLLHQTL